VWRDAHGVTCRRWNWRQSPRTRLGPDTTDMSFVSERLELMPLEALHAAEELVCAVHALAPKARTEATTIAAAARRPPEREEQHLTKG
jgi:DNA/RNA-binding domain of Phe-tRNA-synthetase-like protein